MSKASAFKKIVDKLGNSVKHSRSESDAFHKALSDARSADKRINDYTHLYSPEEYAQMKTFLAPDGKSGFAIKPDGDIVSVFSSVRGGGRLDDIMSTALSEGGTKLDAFDKLSTETKGLPDLYSKYGFKEVKREPNWTKGDPDVVFMEHPAAKKIKEIDTPEKAVALKGKEREEYLKALDEVYGDRAKRADVLATQNPEKIRSINAAFDPRFKDSDLILAAKESERGTLGKILHSLGAPQRKAFSSLAERLGVESNPEDSEETARNIVQNVADRMGLPEDSSLVNAGKALGVAGMEVFADPLNAIPFAGLGKMGMKAVNKVDPTKLNRLKKLFRENPKRFEDAVRGKPELEKSLDKLRTVSPVDSSSKITKLRDDAGYGAVGTFDKIENFLKGSK